MTQPTLSQAEDLVKQGNLKAAVTAYQQLFTSATGYYFP
jgi:hypothetical protein